MLIPFIKPILLPVKAYSKIENKWQDNICIQTTNSTCGPSSLATLFKFEGIEKTEEEIAKDKQIQEKIDAKKEEDRKIKKEKEEKVKEIKKEKEKIKKEGKKGDLKDLDKKLEGILKADDLI